MEWDKKLLTWIAVLVLGIVGSCTVVLNTPDLVVDDSIPVVSPSSGFTKADYLRLNRSSADGVTVYEIRNPEAVELNFSNSGWGKRAPQRRTGELDVAINTSVGDVDVVELLMQQNVTKPLMGFRKTSRLQSTVLKDLSLHNLTHLSYTSIGATWYLPLIEVFDYDLRTNTVRENITEQYVVRNVSRVEWVPFNASEFRVAPNSSELLQVKVRPKIVPKRGGWGYNIDNILSFKGFTYDEYAWFNTTFNKRINISLNNTWASENLTDFQVLVVLNTSIITYADFAANGDDIRFVDDDESTQIDFEIDVWNTTGESFIWVQVPELRSDAVDLIQMYYNASGLSSASNGPNTWDNDYALVLHMSEDPSGGTGAIKDSTSNVRNFTADASMTASDSVVSDVGKGVDFDGANDDLVVVSNFAPTLNTTLEYWGNSRDLGSTRTVIQGWRSGTNPLFEFRTDNSSGGACTGDCASYGTIITTDGPSLIEAGTGEEDAAVINAYQYAALVVNGTNVSDTNPVVYIDDGPGSYAEANNGGDVVRTNSGPFYVGAQGGTGLFYNGVIDEIRASTVLRSATWTNSSYQVFARNMQIYGSVENVPVARTACVLSDSNSECTCGSDDVINVSYTNNSATLRFNLASGSSSDLIFIENNAVLDFNTSVYDCVAVYTNGSRFQ